MSLVSLTGFTKADTVEASSIVDSDGKITISNNKNPYDTLTGDVTCSTYTQSGANSSPVFTDTLTVTGSFSKTGGSSLTVNVLDLSTEGVTISFKQLYLYINSELRLGGNTFTTDSSDNAASLILSAGAVLTTASMTVSSDEELSFDFPKSTDSTIAGKTITGADLSTTGTLSLDGATFVDSSISTGSLILGVSSSAGLSIDADTLTYTITALDDTPLTMSGDLTINISLSEEEYAALQAADGVSLVIDTSSFSSVSLSDDILVNFSDGADNSFSYTWEDTSGLIEAGSSLSADVVIPEPSTVSLSLLALAGLLARRRRR